VAGTLEIEDNKKPQQLNEFLGFIKLILAERVCV
jgi:hypothetical protein